MPTTTTPEGTSIAYEVVGSGPSIVLLHGITESRRTRDPLVAGLTAEHTVVLVDLPGHGESGQTASGDLASMAAEVAHVVGALDVGAPLVVGHSLGGIVATAYASAIPRAGRSMSTSPWLSPGSETSCSSSNRHCVATPRRSHRR